MKKLTPKQKLFIKEYLVDLNATQAAIRAGYSAKTARSIGEENLTKPDIQKEIENAIKEREKKVELTAEWVLEELKQNHETARKISELSSSNKALELIGKHLKMFTEKIEHSGEIKGFAIEITTAKDKNE